MKFLSIGFRTAVNQIVTSSIFSRNFSFTSDVSFHAIVTCQGVFAPALAFADYYQFTW